MSEPDKDWEALQSEWQTFQPDIQKIKKKINWVTWRMWSILAFDVVAILSYFPFLYFIVMKEDKSWIFYSWYYFLGILLIYGVYLDFKIRLPILRFQGESAKAVLQLYLKRTEAGVVIGKIGKNFCWLLLVGFWLWFTANRFLLPEDPKASSLGFLVFGTLWIGGIGVICFWYQKKKEKEQEKLQVLWQDYLD
ncbi:hypothetical protein [Aliikangiella coralliicola]|uniref:Uncharacterized protein n=1 Tax=Aliikangiella coralliicola TaxID=2592383 RepID=A0A545UBN7_9GAMM|nr:hypothetical protein [Aliikangiella coralliicola]TQV86880.1 hypothetical protein FLL46_13770 [Aliikangiella coralliicola]